MADDTGLLHVSFNGEIYNFPELRRELVDRGHRFSTHSDTEVVLHLYREHGIPALERLNGIFSIALHDGRHGSLLLARDHFGVKPLYYALLPDAVVFGSEIKSILAVRPDLRKLDLDAVSALFTLRYNPAPLTMFKDIRKLPAGHCLRVSHTGSASIERYWRYSPATLRNVDENEAVDEYARLFGQAVRRQMLADVPVGLFLSGGVDSAAIGWQMVRSGSAAIKSFSIGFPGRGDFNELDDARESAALLGTQHHEMSIGHEEYLRFFPRSFHFTEEPIAEPTIPALYHVAKLAASHLKVVLAGQGADEPMAGYKRYFGARLAEAMGPSARMIPFRLLKLLNPRNSQIRQFEHASQFTSELDRIVAVCSVFTPEMKRRIFGDAAGACRDRAPELLGALLTRAAGLPDPLDRMLFVDARSTLSDDLLLFNDKMTMANSIEMRVPFLDLDLVTFVESLPAHMKLRGLTGKYIHKQAIARWLPDRIIRRKKRGFWTPMERWLRSDLAAAARRVLNEKGSAASLLLRLDEVNRLLDEHRAGKADWHKQIFLVLAFELWFRYFFEQRPVDEEILLAHGVER